MQDERRVKTDLGELATYVMGEGPPVFLWPSLYVDHESLLPLARELARDRRCILVDGPGHGRSAVPDRRYTLDDCARAATQVLDHLGAVQVDWIGNAWGGHVGLLSAIATPSRIRSLVVIGSPLHAMSTSMRIQTRLGLALLALGARDLVGSLIAKAMVAPGAPPACRDYVRRCIRDAPAGGISRAVHSISLGRPDVTAAVVRVGVPTLFIAGGNDPLLPADVARAQAALVPGAQLAIVPAAAHLVPLERPAETHAAVAGFLAAQASGATSGTG